MSILRRAEFPEMTAAEMQEAFAPAELAQALGDLLVARVPPVMLTALHSRVRAQRALTLKPAETVVISADNINVVIPHIAVLDAAISARLPGAEAMTLAAQLVHAASGAGAISLETLVAAGRHLADFLPMRRVYKVKD